MSFSTVLAAVPQVLRGRPRAWGIEAVLESIVALAAISGGLTMLFAPDGSKLGVTVALLAKSPFTDFTVPGLLLAGVVGGLNATAATLTIRHSRWARTASLLAGGALTAFVAIEVLMIPHSPLQIVLGVMGITISMLAAPWPHEKVRS